MKIVVTGSIAFDYIMCFPGEFKQHILPEKIEMLNVSFLVDSMQKLRGGCAPNIAYSLALLGFNPYIMGTVGKDFEDYKKWLEKYGVNTKYLKTIPDEFTATCYVTTDKNHNQIACFYPGAMSYARDLSFKDIDYKDINMAVISANDPIGFNKYIKECKELKIPYMYDASQQIPRITGDEIKFGIMGSAISVFNEYEYELVINKTGMTQKEILENTEMLIITKGCNGSEIITKNERAEIKPAKANCVIDPTGAGDAYRAGIIKGWIENRSLEEIGMIASTSSVYAVEKLGTNEHFYTSDEFNKRLAENFPEICALITV